MLLAVLKVRGGYPSDDKDPLPVTAELAFPCWSAVNNDNGKSVHRLSCEVHLLQRTKNHEANQPHERKYICLEKEKCVFCVCSIFIFRSFLS
jgi:hypothetical protein